LFRRATESEPDWARLHDELLEHVISVLPVIAMSPVIVRL